MIVLFAVADVVWTAVIVAVGGLLTGLVLGWQAQRSKREDYKRQDDAAEKVEEAKVALAEEDAARREDAAKVAEIVKEAARQLALADAKKVEGTDEVARLQAGDKSGGKSTGPFQTGPFRAIIISHPSGYRREATLVRVPIEGEDILLRGTDPDGQPMRVVKILHIEGNGNVSPSTIVVVCPPDEGDEMSLKEVRTLKDGL